LEKNKREGRGNSKEEIGVRRRTKQGRERFLKRVK
jgi:hypothetical protein